MTSLTRWKLACGLLAALTTFLVLDRGDGESMQPDRPRAKAGQRARPQVPARLHGAVSDELVRALRGARTLSELQPLAIRLGATGDDGAIDAIRSLVGDPRPGVPEAILHAIGDIGTDHAVGVLGEYLANARAEIRGAATVALGRTHNVAAEALLIPLAQRRDPEPAVMALGELGTDAAIEALLQLAGVQHGHASRLAIYTLAGSEARAAVTAMGTLVDSPSIVIATTALEAISTIDDVLFEKLTKLLETGELALVEPAIVALSHAGERSLPVLREIALHGRPALRVKAIQALAGLRSPDALRTLGTLLDAGDGDSAAAAAQALAATESPEAHELLIASALSDRAHVTGAIELLMTLTGSDIDQTLLAIGKTDRRHRHAVLSHLLGTGNAEATALVTQLATSGTEAERSEALQLFVDADSPEATRTLLALARSQQGAARVEAIDLLGNRVVGNPEITRLLQDSLQSSDPAEAGAPAGALAKAGTPEARDALIAALSGGDDELTAIAMRSLREFRLTPDMSSALVAAAHANPELVDVVMDRLVGDGSPQGLELAQTMLAKPGHEASRAIDALEGAGTPAAIQLIEQAVASGDPVLRRQAIASLGALRATGATESVVGALRDADAEVRVAAIDALSGLATDRASAALIEVARTGITEDRQAAVTGLRDHPDPAVGGALVQLMHDRDADVALAAMNAAVVRGTDLERELSSLVRNASTSAAVRLGAAEHLREQGIPLDERLEAELALLVEGGIDED